MLDFAASQYASADLHTLTGSSRPDGVPTFTPVATAAHPGRPLMALTAVGSAMAGLQIDGEVIGLAERVTALAKREQRACTRRATIEDHVQSEWDGGPSTPNSRTGCRCWGTGRQRAASRSWSRRCSPIRPTRGGCAPTCSGAMMIGPTRNQGPFPTHIG